MSRPRGVRWGVISSSLHLLLLSCILRIIKSLSVKSLDLAPVTHSSKSKSLFYTITCEEVPLETHTHLQRSFPFYPRQQWKGEEEAANMHFPITAAILLAATFSLTTTLAAPLPPSSDFNDIERRWSKGQSEVCYIGNQPGCFVLAWVQAMMHRRVCIPIASQHTFPKPQMFIRSCVADSVVVRSAPNPRRALDPRHDARLARGASGGRRCEGL